MSLTHHQPSNTHTWLVARKLAISLVVTGSLLATAACASVSSSNIVPIGARVSNAADRDAQVVAAKTNVDDKEKVDAGKQIEVTTQDPWTVESITTETDAGSNTETLFTATTWRSPILLPNQEMTVTATLRHPISGATQEVQRTVKAGPAPDTFTATMFPADGTYGVGVIPTVTFSQPIPEADRAEIEKRLIVTATPAPVSGTWRWLDSATAAFRPADFWPAHTQVSVKADIKDAYIDAANGFPKSWGAKSAESTWQTDRALVINVDSARHSGTASIDGKVVRKFGVSTGKEGYITRSGIKTLTEKYEVQRMTNIGVTDDEVYDLQVPYAMRMTASGEFLHAAPWNSNIGVANTSHGCTNLKMADAIYIFNQMMWGDPVVTKGTNRPMETDNGPGALWNIPYASWHN